MSNNRFRVYEVVNLDAMELVIGVSDSNTDMLTLYKSAARPTWKKADRIMCRVVEEYLTLKEAAEFAVDYSHSTAMAKYAVYVGPSLETEPA